MTEYWFPGRFVSNRDQNKCGYPKTKSQTQAFSVIGSRGEGDEVNMRRQKMRSGGSGLQVLLQVEKCKGLGQPSLLLNGADFVL